MKAKIIRDGAAGAAHLFPMGTEIEVDSVPQSLPDGMRVYFAKGLGDHGIPMVQLIEPEDFAKEVLQ